MDDPNEGVTRRCGASPLRGQRVRQEWRCGINYGAAGVVSPIQLPVTASEALAELL